MPIIGHINTTNCPLEQASSASVTQHLKVPFVLSRINLVLLVCSACTFPGGPEAEELEPDQLSGEVHIISVMF